jgi:hypothetical protein
VIKTNNMYELYGTYLTHLVQVKIEECGPIKVSEIAEQLAPQLNTQQKKNLCKRIRNSISQLCTYEIVRWEYDYTCNIPTKTYSIYEKQTIQNGSECHEQER